LYGVKARYFRYRINQTGFIRLALNILTNRVDKVDLINKNIVVSEKESTMSDEKITLIREGKKFEVWFLTPIPYLPCSIIGQQGFVPTKSSFY